MTARDGFSFSAGNNLFHNYVFYLLSRFRIRFDVKQVIGQAKNGIEFQLN